MFICKFVGVGKMGPNTTILRYIVSTFEKIEILALSNRGFHKLSNDTKIVKIELILLKVPLSQLKCVFLFFSLYFAQYFVNYLRINLADKMSLSLYWVTNAH